MKRDLIINELAGDWDVIVIGGGITGAGIFNEASKQGYKSLLVEQHDFAWGTSSRSAKLVHGGLRYLEQGQIGTTWNCVRERENLLKEYKNLIQPIRFLYPAYKGDFKSHLLKLGLNVYDLMAKRRDYLHHNEIDFKMQAPIIKYTNLNGGYSFSDAITDDARLVLRVINDAENNGGVAINYLKVQDLIKNKNGQIKGVIVSDKLTTKEYSINAKVVINATGIFSDDISSKIGKKPVLRKLRGSHIIFSNWRFPIYQAISFNHPEDGRPLYVLPWQGMTLFGTTDLEHDENIYDEPKISKKESEYLFSALAELFPNLKLTKTDAVSTFSGVRPVINTGKEDPSKESREHMILSDNGLISVTGGKLTTFRLIASDVLREVKKYISEPFINNSNSSDKISEHNFYSGTFNTELTRSKSSASKGGGYQRAVKSSMDSTNIQRGINPPLNEVSFNRLERTFGEKAWELIKDKKLLSLGYIDNTDVLWAELILSARNEQVVHLDDLMLRRSRIGLIADNGGIHLLDKIEKYIAKDLNYDKIRFEEEKNQYIKLWQKAYSPDLL